MVVVVMALITISTPIIVFAEKEVHCPENTTRITEKQFVGGKLTDVTRCKIDNPAEGLLVGTDDFRTLLVDIIEILLYFAGGIAVLFLIIGGFQYIAARGNEETTEKAKKTITGAIIGIIIIVMAFAIVAIVNSLLTRGPT